MRTDFLPDSEKLAGFQWKGTLRRGKSGTRSWEEQRWESEKMLGRGSRGLVAAPTPHRPGRDSFLRILPHLFLGTSRAHGQLGSLAVIDSGPRSQEVWLGEVVSF